MIITQGGCGHDRDNDPTDMNVAWNPPLMEVKMPWKIHPHRLQAVVESLLGAIDIPISHPGVNIEYMEFDSNRLLVQVVLDNGDDSNDFPQHVRLTLTVDDDV
jgi:hypothetical protein